MAAAITAGPALDKARTARAAGNLEGAASHYKAALDVLGPAAWESPHGTGVLAGYGAVLVELGRWEHAKPVLDRALDRVAADQRISTEPQAVFAMLGGALRTAHEGARLLNLNIVIEGESGDPRGDFARERLPEARHPAVLLARANLELGDAAAVEPLYRRYLGLLDAQGPALSALGVRVAGDALAHAPAEADLLGFAVLLHRAGQAQAAMDALERASRFNLDRVRDSTRFPLVEAQLGAVRDRRLMTGVYLQMALQEPATLAPDALRWIASSKRLATRIATDRRLAISTAQGPRAALARERIDQLEQQLVATPLVGEDGLARYSTWSNEYAQAVSTLGPTLNLARTGRMIDDGTGFVARLLNRIGDGAYIGFIQYRPFDPQTHDLAEPRYLRYVVTAKDLQIRDIGSRRDIDRQVAQWRQRIDRPIADTAERGLARSMLAKLPESARTASDWHLDLDGLLNLLPFEALRLDDGAALVQRHRIRYVDGLAPAAASDPSTAASNEALIVADPLFASTVPTAAPAALPETRREAESAAAALRRAGFEPRVVLGAEATPAALLYSSRSPAVLHVATHGFIYGPNSWQAGDGRSTRVSVLVPGMMSGLILAPHRDKSIVYASQLATMDLRGTRLLVLSACDTGNGAIDVGEGLAGLRRAALIAGAGNVITSLWAVPSSQTAQLMSRFYDLLAAGEAPVQALQSAKTQAMAEGWPVRAWAGFVLASRI